LRIVSKLIIYNYMYKYFVTNIFFFLREDDNLTSLTPGKYKSP